MRFLLPSRAANKINETLMTPKVFFRPAGHIVTTLSFYREAKGHFLVTKNILYLLQPMVIPLTQGYISVLYETNRVSTWTSMGPNVGQPSF